MKLVQPIRARELRLLLAAIGLSLMFGTLVPSALAAENCESAMTTAEMVQCAGKSYDAANEELAGIYDRLHERLDPERQAVLEAAQDAWEIYRDLNAEFVASAVDGGTLHTILMLAEMLEMTRHRADELRARLEEQDY